MARPSTERFVRTLEISAAAYKEIEDKLIDAGFSFLVFPPARGLNLEGILIVPEKWEMVEAGGCAPPIFAKVKR